MTSNYCEVDTIHLSIFWEKENEAMQFFFFLKLTTDSMAHKTQSWGSEHISATPETLC